MGAQTAADRFARQRIIPGWDQGRVSEATAVVAGVGALGNEVAKNLALAGVGRLILCDPDTVAVSNLSRTVLLGAGDVGRPKATIAAQTLRTLAPGTIVQPRIAELGHGIGLGELADATVVVSCVDTIRARMQLLGRCTLVGAALVDGGTQPFGGEVRLRLSPDEACYGCTLSAHERGVSDLPWSCFGAGPGGPQPASIATTALVAGWMSLIVLQVILGAPPAYRLLSIDATVGRAAPVSITRDPECPHHRPLTGPVVTISVSNRDTVGELIAELAAGVEPYTWDRFPVGERCGGCDNYSENPGFVGDIDNDMIRPCGRCGGLIRMRFSQRLRDADPSRRLSDLGVAPEELILAHAPGGGYTCHRLSQ
ncbi:MAG TPA: ThiF family adenylyltransferase [Streptosporangiaceae bacterium]|nr:ThiF family adenylyltransferase [Streptosporangiaceae bacterium]